jgi:hypothetical protein
MTISTTGTAELHAVLFATADLASFGIIAVARRSVQENALSISSSAGKATAVGYGVFKRPEREEISAAES